VSVRPLSRHPQLPYVYVSYRDKVKPYARGLFAFYQKVQGVVGYRIYTHDYNIHFTGVERLLCIEAMELSFWATSTYCAITRPRAPIFQLLFSGTGSVLCVCVCVSVCVVRGLSLL
jgi:hypothetical protein